MNFRVTVIGVMPQPTSTPTATFTSTPTPNPNNGIVNFYVSPNGTGGCATVQSPCLLSAALAQVQPGQTIALLDGNYPGFSVHGLNGTQTQPITIKAKDGNARVTLDSGRVWYEERDRIFINNSSYIILDGLKAFNGTRAGLRVSTSHHISIQNGEFGDNQTWGIFTDHSPHLLLSNNKTYGSRVEHGIYVADDSQHAVIRGNEVYGNFANGIQTNTDEVGDKRIYNALIENNTVYNNGLKGLSIISTTDSTIRNNLIYNNGTRNAGAGGIHLAQELGAAGISKCLNNVIVNNTVVESRITAIRTSSGQASGNIFFNNIAIREGGTAIADEDGTNHFHLGSNVQSNSSNGFFVNPSAGDYKLIESSPARNSGIASYQSKNAPVIDKNGASRPQGNMDSGAFERP